MDQITEHLFLGSMEDAANLDLLRQHRIDSVASVAKEAVLDLPWRKIGGLRDEAPKYDLYLAQEDSVPIPQEFIEKYLTWMKQQILYHRRRVLVHCGAGISRAPSFTIGYLMFCGFSWDDAEAWVQVKRANVRIQPHGDLKKSFLKYFNAWPYNTYGLDEE